MTCSSPPATSTRASGFSRWTSCGDRAQTLSFDDTPILVALINKSLGADLTSEWFPVLPPNRQSPYDPGPYPKAATAPIETMRAVTDAEAQSAAAAYEALESLPKG